MMTIEFITALFYEVDEQLRALPKHPEARLWPRRWSPWGCSMPSKAGQPGVLSLADARLSPPVPPPPRAHAALSSVRDPSGLDAGVLGCSDRAWGHRHVWDRAHPSDAGRAQPAADWPQRPLEPPLDRRGETLSAAQPVGVDRGVGVCTANVADNTVQWLIQQVDGRMGAFGHSDVSRNRC